MRRYTGRSSLKKTHKIFPRTPPPGTFSESAHDYVYIIYNTQQVKHSEKVLDVAFIMYSIFRIGTQTIGQEQKIYFNPPVSDIFERNKLRQCLAVNIIVSMGR